MIEVASLTFDAICESALAELKMHPNISNIPVDVEHLVEITYGIGVYPVPGLRQIDIEAFISISNLQITVDQDLWEKNINRYRFSLAHEIGHLKLHANTLQQYPCRNATEYQEFIKALNDGAYTRLESQANTFAGCLLMPPPQLGTDIDAALMKTKGYHFQRAELLEYVASYLATRYIVSQNAMQIQIEKCGLIKKIR